VQMNLHGLIRLPRLKGNSRTQHRYPEICSSAAGDAIIVVLP
jgi:hypothetical protein